MTLEQYINNLNQRYQLGNTTEHTFRGDLQQRLETVSPNFNILFQCSSPILPTNLSDDVELGV